MAKNKKTEKSKFSAPLPMGKDLSFEVSEAFNLLRTNIGFSFADSDGCKIIGITSSIKGEGKSMTSLNLAYSIALTDKKVVAIECDLRLPTFTKKLNTTSNIGFTDVIVGQVQLSDVIVMDVLAPKMDIIPAGNIPPNATQLLESERTAEIIKELSEHYDYIILDLPPVLAVPDALIMSKIVSGMLVVVREDYVTKNELNDTMRQLKYINANVLGFVYNIEGAGTSYGYKKKYGYKRQYEYYKK